jgi:hypothetical protein
MAEFRKTFDRPLEPGFVAELHVANWLGLEICEEATQAGFDARGPDGTRYQIKYRHQATRNVDVNNFEFDQLVLVNLDDDYQLAGMWCLSVEQAKELFTWRERFRKYQVTQKCFKQAAERID